MPAVDSGVVANGLSDLRTSFMDARSSCAARPDPRWCLRFRRFAGGNLLRIDLVRALVMV